MSVRCTLSLAVLLFSSSVSIHAQTAMPWQTGAYVYDGAGNIKAIGATEQYRYDALGRLRTGTIATGQTQTATYDLYGNVKTLTTNGTALSIGVNRDTNRAVWPVDPDTGVPYNIYATYDNAGRLTSALNGTGGTFAYDAADAVMKSTVEGVTRVHLYTASDERIASVTFNSGTESVTDWTLRDATGRVLRRLQKNGSTWALKEDYIYASGQMLASEVDTAVGTLHYFSDHLGTPRLITGNGGAKVALHTYFPFGAEATSPLQDAEKLKFTGHERDSDNLDYMRARYYAPKWGRFLSVDPTWDSADAGSPQSWNRYAYAQNNPLNRIDPDGESSLVYNSHTGYIALYSGEGVLIGAWPAGNNVDSSSQGVWPEGVYTMLDQDAAHLHGEDGGDTRDGPYGTQGIFRAESFMDSDGDWRSGMGVHAGRENDEDGLGRSGVEYATMGCIRTTEEAMEIIAETAPVDPIETIEVVRHPDPPRTDFLPFGRFLVPAEYDRVR